MTMLCGRAIGLGEPLFLIAGPCVIESEALALAVAERLRALADETGILLIYKSSFDKANRSSNASFRGPGLDEGLRILEKVRAETGLPVLTDVHEPSQVRAVAQVVDMLQTPAFLARQTDLIEAVAVSGKPGRIDRAQVLVGRGDGAGGVEDEVGGADGRDGGCVRRLSSPGRPTSSRQWRRAAKRQTSRRRSSWRRATWSTSSPRRAMPPPPPGCPSRC